jgi:ABC-2 type transport system permease protein
MAMTSQARSAGFAAVVARELRRWTRAPLYLMMLAGLPAAATLVIVGIFGSGAARDLPIAVVDLDGSALSREAIRMIDATGGVRVASVERDAGVAQRLVAEGRIYGFVVVPERFEKDVARGAAPSLSAFYNSQFILPAGLIKNALVNAVGTLSGRVEVRQRMGAGESFADAVAHVEPIGLDIHTLFNTELNYVTYLVSALLPTLLQIFILTISVHAFAIELRDGTAGEWLEAAGGSVFRAIAGKALPYVVQSGLLGLLMVSFMYGWLGVPFRGDLAIVAWSTAVFGAAYVAMGFAFAASTGNLRLGTSVAAFYCAPAFAFVGVTFPTEAMPVVGQAWSSLLPVTHYLRILVQQGMRGAPADVSWHTFTILTAFALAPWPLLTWRMARLMRNPRAWGRT